VQRVEVAAKNAIGRPVRFTVIDDAGRAYLMSGEDLRTAVNTGAPAWGRLPSSLFRIDDRGPAIAFVDGHGRGHGVGLCQWCAQAQALQGMDDRQIVLSAYPSAVILRAY
jgi:peptidoglycan hydrolase-like amidase